jgi:3-oxoacyl-[acyl-carrier protein] reductase
MASLSEKIAIVTGASSRIGQAIAERLAKDGAIVVVNYRTSAEKARNVVTDIQAKGGKDMAVQADMSQAAEARRLVVETVTQFAGSTSSSTMPGGLCQSLSWRPPR